MRRFATFCLALGAALAFAGCANTYELRLMPRDSGRIYTGTAIERGYGEGTVSVDIDGKKYDGTWVQTAPTTTHGWITGGFGWGFGRRGFGGLGTSIAIDNPYGGEVKALLTAADGSGLRCDFRSADGRGGGTCRDDRGREYDVQLRAVARG
jgi:hypothetical protein